MGPQGNRGRPERERSAGRGGEEGYGMIMIAAFHWIYLLSKSQS